MIVVLDASAAVKLVLDEAGSDVVRRVWDERPTIVAPSIVAPEVATAIGAARRHGRLSEADSRAAHRSWVALVGDIPLLAVDAGLAERARELAATRAVRGMDAVYLAVAATIGTHQRTGLMSFDVRQRASLHDDDGVDLLPAEVGATA